VAIRRRRLECVFISDKGLQQWREKHTEGSFDSVGVLEGIEVLEDVDSVLPAVDVCSPMHAVALAATMRNGYKSEVVNLSS